MRGPKLELTGKSHRFHICAGLPCKQKLADYLNAVHVSKWRILTFAQGESLLHIGTHLRDFAAASAEAADAVKVSSADDLDDDEPLRGGDITCFQGVAARCTYLGPDRPDCNFAIKELCREISAPTTGSLRWMKRLGRYLKGSPRVG